MAPTRVLTKRLYINTNGGNNNVSLDWVNTYNSNPYGYSWNPPRMRVELLAPNNEPTLYSAQGYGGTSNSAVFINPVDVIYQPVGGSSVPYALALGPQAGFNGAYNNYNQSGYYNNLYGAGLGWYNDFNQINAN